MTTVLAEPGDAVLRPHAGAGVRRPSWTRWPRPTTGRGRRAGGCRPRAVAVYLLGRRLAPTAP